MRRSLSCQVVVVLGALSLLTACGKEAPKPAPAPLEVSIVTVKPGNIDISREYVAQTQSSQAVNIQARVSGLLDKRVYTEGAVVKNGQVLFQMDQKPFQAQVDAAQGRAAAQAGGAAGGHSRTSTAPSRSAQQNALSQKDLDDATGQYEQAAAAVEQAKAQLETAQLNLSYTTIRSPVDGVSSYAQSPTARTQARSNAQLTTVSVLTPMWINFSISENEMERIRNDVRNGPAQAARRRQVHRRSRDGRRRIFPVHRRITFADPSYNPTDGHVPAARDGQQSGRRAAAQPIRARAPHGRDPAERDRGSAARRAAEREGPFRLGR